jgi:hypothetical protein
MSDFLGPDGTGYSFPPLPGTAAGEEDWQTRCLLKLAEGPPYIFPGTINRAVVAALPTPSLQGLVRAYCLTSP